MKKVLIATLHRPDRSPSQRFRIEQYLPYLEENGFSFDFSYLLNQKDDKLFYQPGRFAAKSFILLRSIGKRVNNLIPYGKYDIVFVQREAFMLGTTVFERLLKNSGAKLIFDFDDAIWLHNISEGNKKFSFLKNPAKTADLVKMADLVFAGNPYLREYALRYSKSVALVPTTIDTKEYKPAPTKRKDKIIIGWSGSVSTVQHFEYLLPVLYKIKEKYKERVEFKLIGDSNYRHALGITGKAWIKEEEIPEISSFDIGIMPLPDDEWTKGKCGLKGLQYMALEVPTIMSAVGVNTDIILDGKNGFLASSEEEWISKLSLLIEDKALREELGKKGRETVEKDYSVNALKEKYLYYFRQLTESS